MTATSVFGGVRIADEQAAAEQAHPEMLAGALAIQEPVPFRYALQRETGRTPECASVMVVATPPGPALL